MAETWVLNADENTTKLTNTNVNFTSNNQSFKGIGAAYAPSYGPFEIRYYQTTVFQSGTQVKTEDGTWVDDAWRTIVFDEPVTDTTLLTWLQANGTKVVSLHDQAEQCITDAYTAIGNKSGTIPTQKNLQNLAGAIDTISTGVDTSDGNIEPTTVLKGYKGYAKGVAVNGAIETYDGTVGDIGFNITVTDFYASSGGSGNNNIYIAFDRVPTSTDYDYSFVTQTDDYTPIVKDKTGKVVTAPLTISGVKTINVIETTTGSNVWFTVYSGTQRLIDITQDNRSGSYTFTQNITDMKWAGSYNE